MTWLTRWCIVYDHRDLHARTYKLNRWSTASSSDNPIHGGWYQSKQDVHSMYLPSSGIRHMQNSWYFFVRLGFLVGTVSCGNMEKLSAAMHCLTCFLISDWSKFRELGSVPLHKATANATANKPQSLDPVCCCTFWCIICYCLPIRVNNFGYLIQHIIVNFRIETVVIFDRAM